MSDNENPFFPGADMFTRAWSDFASQMMKAGVAFTPDSAPPQAAKEIRSAMFKAWGDYCDQFMRSPEFLDMMKQSLSVSVQARKQLNDFLGQVQHDFQGASRQDVDQLMLSFRRLERRIVDEMERLTDKLGDLATRLDQIQQDLDDRGKDGKKPSSGGKKKKGE